MTMRKSIQCKPKMVTLPPAVPFQRSYDDFPGHHTTEKRAPPQNLPRRRSANQLLSHFFALETQIGQEITDVREHGHPMTRNTRSTRSQHRVPATARAQLADARYHVRHDVHGAVQSFLCQQVPLGHLRLGQDPDRRHHFHDADDLRLFGSIQRTDRRTHRRAQGDAHRCIRRHPGQSWPSASAPIWAFSGPARFCLPTSPPSGRSTATSSPTARSRSSRSIRRGFTCASAAFFPPSSAR